MLAVVQHAYLCNIKQGAAIFEGTLHADAETGDSLQSARFLDCLIHCISMSFELSVCTLLK